MSLNRYEQIMFDYWQKQPDERRHWQEKVAAMTRGAAEATEQARALERELWGYFVERAQHVPSFRTVETDGPRRTSLLNLADHLIRLWGPVPKPKKPSNQPVV